MPRSLVALSASAVAAIYFAGYARTQSADASIDDITTAVASTSPTTVATVQPSTAIAPTQRSARARQAQPSAQTAPSSPSTSTTAPSAPSAPSTTAPSTSSSTAPASSTAPVSSTATQSTYKDGTFSGSGTSRRGSVWVDVTINGGKIELVTITRSTLQYPVRDIAGLPAEVVAKQTSQVNIVSGATYSSQAFRTAVSQALQAARA